LLQVFPSRREYPKGFIEIGAGLKWLSPLTGRIECDPGPVGLIPALVSCGRRPYYRGVGPARSRNMRKGEQTRQEIIRRAAPIFNQKGYGGPAPSDLMKATGLEKGGIYRHFDSKEMLAAEAFDYAWRETLNAR